MTWQFLSFWLSCPFNFYDCEMYCTSSQIVQAFLTLSSDFLQNLFRLRFLHIQCFHNVRTTFAQCTIACLFSTKNPMRSCVFFWPCIFNSHLQWFFFLKVGLEKYLSDWISVKTWFQGDSWTADITCIF